MLPFLSARPQHLLDPLLESPTRGPLGSLEPLLTGGEEDTKTEPHRVGLGGDISRVSRSRS